jgi:hypothetical protein
MAVQKALEALLDAWFKAGGSAEEAVEVITATAKGLRRKYADRRPWAQTVYMEGGYRIGLGRARRLCGRRFPQRAVPRTPFMRKAFTSSGWAAARGAHAFYAEGMTTFG